MQYPNTILRGLAGSIIHGLSVDNNSDRDELGICVEPFEHFFGLRDRFEQYTHRTQPTGVRSGPGDLDLTIYSLAKWTRLALDGNPTILTMLFLPRWAILEITPIGEELLTLAPKFLSPALFTSYIGYMVQQRQRLTKRVKMPKRPELIEKYGYDTKYASHMIRLGHQGLELARTGKLSLPMEEGVRNHIRDIRQGKLTELEVIKESTLLEYYLQQEKQANKLPPADVATIERFVINAYLSTHEPRRVPDGAA